MKGSHNALYGGFVRVSETTPKNVKDAYTYYVWFENVRGPVDDIDVALKFRLGSSSTMRLAGFAHLELYIVIFSTKRTPRSWILD